MPAEASKGGHLSPSDVSGSGPGTPTRSQPADNGSDARVTDVGRPTSPAQGGLLHAARSVHLVGIGGSGMSPLAQLLVRQGKQVTGSDISREAATRLSTQGLRVSSGHRAEQVGEAEVVVVSAAVPADNPELAEARRRGLPVLTHAEALGELMAARVGVAVAGTHGKTTTTAMLAFILAQAGLDPTALVGATVLNFESGARVGRGQHFVVEADEYDRRFLTLQPYLAVVTGIEPDHLDYFRDLEEIRAAFVAFAGRLEPDGVLVTCADDPVLARTELPRRRVTYGTRAPSDWRLCEFQPQHGGGSNFELAGPSGAHRVVLQLSGRHNACNAAGAIAAASELGVAADEAAAALVDFRGTERRFETLYRERGIWLVDDYAHHPTAVQATLAAAREVHRGRLWAAFQPHTSNRVANLLGAFATCFEVADRLMLLPIYHPAGREREQRAITSADLAAVIRQPPVTLVTSLDAAEEQLTREARPGDLVLVMGAGDVTRLAHSVSRRLAALAPNA